MGISFISGPCKITVEFLEPHGGPDKIEYTSQSLQILHALHTLYDPREERTFGGIGMLYSQCDEEVRAHTYIMSTDPGVVNALRHYLTTKFNQSYGYRCHV